MPTPSSDAMQFFLSLDDQLTPELGGVAKRYKKFTKEIDRENQRMVKSVGKTFQMMTQMAESLGEVPQQIARATQRTMSGMGRSRKPMKVQVELTLSGKKIDKQIAEAIVSGAKSSRRRAPRGGGSTATESALAALTAPQFGPALPPGYAVREYQRRMNARGRTGNYMDSRTAAKQATATAALAAADQAWSQASSTAMSAKTSREARQSLAAAFTALPAAERKKRLADYARLMNLAKQIDATQAAAAKNATVWGRAVGVMQRGFGVIGGITRGMAGDVREITGNTRFMTIVSALDRFGGLFTGANQYLQGMNNLNKSLNLTRTELAEITKMGADIAQSYGTGVLNPETMEESMRALATFGTRARSEFEKLAPTVALATQAMNITPETAAQLARQLGVKFKLSKDEVADFFGDIGRVQQRTGVSGEDLGASAMSNITRMGGFLSNLSAGDRKGVLTNMATLQGVLAKNFGDSGNNLGGMIADALSDATSQSALNVANLTGLTGGSGGSLAQAIKSGNLGAIVGGIGDRARAAGGNSTVLAQLASAMGFQGDPGQFAQFATASSDMINDISNLNKELAGSTGFEKLATDAANAKSEIDKLKNSVKNFMVDALPAWALQGLGELSSSGTGIVAGATLGGFVTRAMGKIPGIGPMLQRIPVIGRSFAPIAARGAATLGTGAGGAGAGGISAMARGAGGIARGSAIAAPIAMAAHIMDKVFTDANSDVYGSGSWQNIAAVASGSRNLRQDYVTRGAMILGNLDSSAPDTEQAHRIQELLGSMRTIMPSDMPGRQAILDKVEQAAWTNPESVPAMLKQIFPALVPQIAAAELEKAKAAQAERERAVMMQNQAWMGMAPGLGSVVRPWNTGAPTPAPTTVAPRPTPTDQVVRAAAQGNF